MWQQKFRRLLLIVKGIIGKLWTTIGKYKVMWQRKLIRNALASHFSRPKVIIDIAHTGSGFRVWQGMKKLAELGFATVCSVHAQREFAMKHCYVPVKGRTSYIKHRSSSRKGQ